MIKITDQVLASVIQSTTNDKHLPIEDHGSAQFWEEQDVLHDFLLRAYPHVSSMTLMSPEFGFNAVKALVYLSFRAYQSQQDTDELNESYSH
jgi:hypothetical protein